jgi:transcriptional regulator with XRE-family HTH domain
MGAPKDNRQRIEDKCQLSDEEVAVPHPTDIHVGRRVRQARLAKKFSQGTMGRSLGVSFQQIQKYESGANRIGSSRLWDISVLLETPVEFFFDGLQDQGPEGNAESKEPPLSRRTIELARLIERVPSEEVRNGFLRLIEACVSARKN